MNLAGEGSSATASQTNLGLSEIPALCLNPTAPSRCRRYTVAVSYNRRYFSRRCVAAVARRSRRSNPYPRWFLQAGYGS